MMEKQFDSCSFCGTELLPGYMKVIATRSGALYWKSEHKKPRGNIPSFLKKTPLGLKRETYKLMSTTGIFGGVTSCDGWFCPICRIVIAAFAVDQE